jgi:hypothetical protein
MIGCRFLSRRNVTNRKFPTGRAAKMIGVKINGSAIRPPAEPGPANRPIIEIVAPARNNPSGIAPVSPMKILAGKKVNGRNPINEPNRAAGASGARGAGPRKSDGRRVV